MKKAEVKGLSTKELNERVDAEISSLNQMKINHSISPLDNPAKINELRRSIARLKTELHQREQQTINKSA
ncbi:MAG: 50S ribosomal protein L29 [Tannerella sp.]|jgi:large subunit ribosomal protein L29|nr:50S ribosomal protein L29 [Tannerella sp.]